MICPSCGEEIEPVEEVTSKISIVKDAHGRLETWTEEMKDAVGAVVSKRVDRYNYHKTGEVDTITQQVYGDKGKLVSEKETKHFTDGSQPVTKATEVGKCQQILT